MPDEEMLELEGLRKTSRSFGEREKYDKVIVEFFSQASSNAWDAADGVRWSNLCFRWRLLLLWLLLLLVLLRR